MLRTIGRYMITSQSAHHAGTPTSGAIGYSNDLADACVEAHSWASSRAPLVVLDTENRNELVHTTHAAIPLKSAR